VERSIQTCRNSEAGFTLAETLVSTAVALIGLAAAVLLNTAHLRLVKSGRQSNAATLSLQERVEEMRLGDWRKITDPDYLANTLLAAPPRSAAPLDAISERVTITAYPDASAAQQLIVERETDGQRVTLLSGSGLESQRLAQVEFRVSWSGSDGRRRLRATTTMISNGGISRMNLPGFGTAGGAPPSSSTPAPSGSGSSTTSSTATATPTPTPIPATNNGNGRGNVAGKSGKK
jgi:Tfp pilus assembly protein PilV